MIFTHCLCRDLYHNRIKSMASGAFSGLGSLTWLYVAMHCRITPYGVCFHILFMQGPGKQPNQIDSYWCIHQTWKPDLLVWEDVLPHHDMIFTHCSCRYLYSNQITSIANGAFTGLGSLTKLYGKMYCHISA